MDSSRARASASRSSPCARRATWRRATSGSTSIRAVEVFEAIGERELAFRLTVDLARYAQ